MSDSGKMRVLIVGKCPPPIGGVSVHVQRLLSALEASFQEAITLQFFDLKAFTLISYVRAVMSVDVVHIHSSSPYLRLLSVIVCWILRKRSIITIHGSLGRFGGIKDRVDGLAVRFSSFPITLNEKSFGIARLINSASVLSSAFIPAHSTHDLNSATVKVIKRLKEATVLYATNAYGLTYDRYGKEIYGIFDLMTVISHLKDVSLIVSDPSASYGRAIEKLGYKMPENVSFISYPHDFNSVLEMADGFIRNTTTDGDSISVHESLYKSKITLCTSCVDRPKGAIVYKGLDELSELLKNSRHLERPAYVMPDVVEQLVRLYQE